METDQEKVIKRRSFLAFGVFAVAEAGGILTWLWFRSLPKSDHGLSTAARGLLQSHEKFNGAVLSDKNLAPVYPKARAVKDIRLNGDIGMDDTFDTEDWKLVVVEPWSQKTRSVELSDIKALPKYDLVFDFKCIEGWDQVVNYSGARFSDFLMAHKMGTLLGKEANIDNLENWYRYVGLETPDGKYFVGMDMKSILHPQTLLCYEQNGKELEYDHGAPLRLITPIKYGVKNLKRIGKIFFSNDKPRDYWFNEGYPYDLTL